MAQLEHSLVVEASTALCSTMGSGVIEGGHGAVMASRREWFCLEGLQMSIEGEP